MEASFCKQGRRGRRRVKIFSLRRYASAPTHLVSALRGEAHDGEQGKVLDGRSCEDMNFSTAGCDVDEGFDFERMTCCFEKIDEEYRACQRPLPATASFVTAMREVVKLFETLGSAFSFVKKDMDLKIGIIASYAQTDPTHFEQLHDGVEYELRTNSARIEPGAPASCSRTLLRLMWALKFADVLLGGLRKAFDEKLNLPPCERTLKWVVNRAYEDALAEHHSWTIRRAVKSACVLLPSKESFVIRVRLTPAQRDDILGRLGACMSPLVKRMYAYYESNHILDLP